MTEDTTNIVLEHLRHIRSQVDHLRSDVGDVKLRVTVIEGHIASLDQDRLRWNRFATHLKRES